MNLGEFRALTKDLPDSADLIQTSRNYELRGSWVDVSQPSLVSVKKVTRQFRDDFDGTIYSTDVYVPDENGKKAIRI